MNKTAQQHAVLFLHNKTSISGGERSLLNLFDNLDRVCFLPLLIVPSNGPFAREAAQRNVAVSYVPVPKLTLKNVLDIISTLIKLCAFCKHSHIHIIHSYTPRNNILSAITGRMLGIPVIWHERNIPVSGEKDISRHYSFLPERIICNSNAVAERFKTKYLSKVNVVINGVDTTHFSPGIPPKELHDKINPENKPVVGLISNLGKRKMPEYFLDAAGHILKSLPQVIFFIVGGEFSEEDKGRQEELVRLTEKSGIRDHIIFTGFVPNVVDYVRLFDIGTAVTEKEACSRAILEMMACGKPIVGFNTGGNPELIEDGVSGKLVEFGNIRALAEAIVGLLNDDAQRKAMGSQARLRTERLFDVRVNARKIQEIYAELICR
jgi:glycosyltransferase involved in cell wall biosynthesis